MMKINPNDIYDVIPLKDMSKQQLFNEIATLRDNLENAAADLEHIIVHLKDIQKVVQGGDR